MPDRPLNRICYVEDDEDIQRIVRMSLERVGKMTVEVVGDPTMAIEAIDRLQARPRDARLDDAEDGRPDAVPRRCSSAPRPRRCRWCSSPPRPRSATWTSS